MIRINLLPVKISKKSVVLRQQAIIAGMALVLVMGVLGVFEVSIKRDMSDVNNKINWTNGEIERLKQAEITYNDLKAKKASVQEKLDTIDNLERNRSGPVHMLDELALAIPMDRKSEIWKKLWLKTMKQSPGKIELTGVALDNEVIANFMDKLSKSPYFTNIVLGGTSQEIGKDVVLYKFSITMGLQTPPAGQGMTQTTKG